MSARACVSNACRAAGLEAAAPNRRGDDGRQHAVGIDGLVPVAEEALDRVEHRVLVADKRQVILAGQLDERARRESGDAT